MKDYKKILEGVVNIIKTTEKSDIGFVNICTYIGDNCPELKESEGEKIRKAIIGYIDHGQHYGVSNKDMIAWLEKQGEQKTTDIAKTKFHEGDWVVIKETTYQISKVEGLNVTLSLNGRECMFSVDVLKNAHLWTIQDAKDGDVLAVNDVVFIYAHRKQLYSIAVAHCFVDSAGDFYFDGEFGYTERGNPILPATKEQRDFLFTKMKEAGYEWDVNKKELKKIEQEPNDNLSKFEDKLCELFQKFRWRETKTNGDILEYVETHVHELFNIINKQSKQEWSEEDESIILGIEQVMNCASLLNIVPDKIDKINTWLKSLRPQNHWKPTKEQLIELRCAISGCSVETPILLQLEEDLKKLL